MTTASYQEVVRPGAPGLGRLRRLSSRPALWRVAAGVAGLALAAMLFFAAPGSVQLIGHVPAAGAPALPAWARPCLAGPYAAPTKPQVAFCGRVDGRVIASSTGADGETHLLVTGGFHVTVVQLPRGRHGVSWGSRVTAVGPLTTTHGLRELQTIRLAGT